MRWALSAVFGVAFAGGSYPFGALLGLHFFAEPVAVVVLLALALVSSGFALILRRQEEQQPLAAQ